MSRLRCWLRKVAEKAIDRYYEGPEPPRRLAEQVVAFAALNKHASRAEWAQFATNLARGAYKDGYLRGLEWTERDLDQLPASSVELAAEHQRYDFDWHSPLQLTERELAERVKGDFLDDLPDDKARAVVLDVMGVHSGGFRIVRLPPEKR